MPSRLQLETVTNKNHLHRLALLLNAWHILFFISIICSFRAVSSISVGLLLVTGVWYNKVATGCWFNYRLYSPFLLTCALFYLLQVVSLINVRDMAAGVKALQTKSAMLFIPLAICCCGFLHSKVFAGLLKWYVWTLAGMLAYCLLLAGISYFFHHATDAVFFYHALVAPFKQHAVQVSIYVFVMMVFLLRGMSTGIYFHNRIIHSVLLCYFTGCLLLLSSKLVISAIAVCFLFYCIRMAANKLQTRLAGVVLLSAVLLFISIVLLSKNKISGRFQEIVSGDLRLPKQAHFDPGIYFNGLQFRMLQWRFVKEILTEQHGWWTGVSNNAQEMLNRKYLSTHMYTGDAHSLTTGYLGYNTHNEFLESLLQVGLPGLISFVLICLVLIRTAVKQQQQEFSIVIALLIAYCFNEAVLETQYGATLFTFFPLLAYYTTFRSCGHVAPL